MIFMNLVVVTFTKICEAILIFIYVRQLTTTLPKTFYSLLHIFNKFFSLLSNSKFTF